MSFWTWFLNALGVGDASGGTGAPRVSAGGVGVATAVAEGDGPDGEGAWWKPGPDAALDLTYEEPPSLSRAATGLQSNLGTYFTVHDSKLPALPNSTARAMAMLNDPNTSLAAVATEIGRDLTLAASVVRTANSAAYCGVERITSLPTAATRIGANALRAVLLRQSLQQVTIHKSGPFREQSERIWKRSLASAATMHTLAPLAGVDKDAAYLVGLLCDIGNVVVLREAQEQDAILRTRVTRLEFEYLCERFHESLGRFIAQSWALPANLQSLIGEHHAWPADKDRLRTPRLLLRLTHMIVANLGYATDGPYDIPGSKAARALGLSEDARLTAALARIPDAIREHGTA